MRLGKAVMCAECEDQEAAMQCDTCVEPFCGPCFQQQHHRGRRASHPSHDLAAAALMPAPRGELIGIGARPLSRMFDC